jgi:hypothetical protein
MPLQGIEKIENNEGSNPCLSANQAISPRAGLFALSGAGRFAQGAVNAGRERINGTKENSSLLP